MKNTLKRKNVISETKGTTTIGIMGAGSGVGTTHTSLLLAVFLSSVCGYKVALVTDDPEKNIRQAKDLIESNKLGRNGARILSKFSLFWSTDQSEISGILAMGYSFVVIDFGSKFDEKWSQFLMCGQKIVVGSTSWLKIREFVDFIARTENEKSAKKWKYFSVEPGENGTRYLKHNFGISVRRIPIEPEPFYLGGDSLNFLQELTKDF